MDNPYETWMRHLDTLDPALADDDATELAWCLNASDGPREALASMVMGGGLDAALAYIWDPLGDAAAPAVAAVYAAFDEPPDMGRCATAVAILGRIADRAPRGIRATPLALAAWVLWTMDEEGRAADKAREALTCDLNCRLARIVLMGAGVNRLRPLWASG